MIVYLQLIDTAEDRSKFEQLYEQYKQLMFYTAFQILKRPQDAEDAVHHAFLSIAENISSSAKRAAACAVNSGSIFSVVPFIKTPPFRQSHNQLYSTFFFIIIVSG